MSDTSHNLAAIQDEPGVLRRSLSRMRGEPIEYDLAPYLDLLDQVNAAEASTRALDAAALSARAVELRAAARGGAELDGLLVETFALVREAARRALDMRHFDEQIIGGVVLHQGKLTEMPTGEGKTLTAVLAAALNALGGDGVHVLTFNDYLARRDAAWMGPVYELLGLRVACVQSGSTVAERQAAYAADVTYLTAKEAGFDHLRDGLCYRPAERVQRELCYAIVDEADSILIDEARIPLVIAGTGGADLPDAKRMAALAGDLEPEVDYEVDHKQRVAFLTEQGLARAEQELGCGSLYQAHNSLVFTLLNQALHAKAILRRDVDYIVRAGEIELVDELTGRVATDRHWPDGLQAAIEAKEGIEPRRAGVVLGQLTLQHYFALYRGLAGMTATARPAEGELNEMYGLVTVPVPSHRPCVREELPDQILTHREAKLQAVEEEITRAHGLGRPVLVGTASVAESEELAARLERAGLDCRVLNAKSDEHEATIIADAGLPGALTISTNMAGRGTDIRLGGADGHAREQVVAQGGLYVIGFNRHESRRVDNQLRGRAGRQGDPGASRFFVSLEDDLIVRHGVEELLFDQHRAAQRGLIESPRLVSRIHWAQRVVEGQSTEIRHALNRFSSIVEQQRQLMRATREEILRGEGARCARLCPEHHAALRAQLEPEQLQEAERQTELVLLDRAWANHLCVIADLREALPMMRLGTSHLHTEFLRRADQAYDDTLGSYERELSVAYQHLEVRDGRIDLEQQGVRGPSATWTYLINDDPFRDALGLDVAGNIGLSIGAALHWPLFLTAGLFKSWRAGARKPRGEDGGDG